MTQGTQEMHLESISKTFKQSPTPANCKLLDQARTELDLCLINEAERRLRWARQKWYAKANKPTIISSKKKTPLRPHHLLWEAELGRQLDPEDWQAMTIALSKCSKNVLTLENAYKKYYIGGIIPRLGWLVLS